MNSFVISNLGIFVRIELNCTVFEKNKIQIYELAWILVQGVFLTVPPHFQYQTEKTCSANEDFFYIEFFLKK